MLKYIAIALVVSVAGILIAAASRPDSFRVERAVRSSAPAEKIFHYVNDFHQWGVWCSDTDVVWTMEGPAPYIFEVMGLIFNMERLLG